jgi:hypothetical protein
MEETIGRDMTQEELDCEERPAREGLQDLFRESAREVGGTWTNSEVRAGSLAASDLVTQQQATSLQACARAIMAAPHVGLGWVFVTVEIRNTKAPNVVWQIEAFAEATQTFVAKRTSTHPTYLGFPSKAVFSLSTVEVLVSPTLPFLNRILEAMGRTKEAAAALFPLADKIVVPSGPTFDALNHSIFF